MTEASFNFPKLWAKAERVFLGLRAAKSLTRTLPFVGEPSPKPEVMSKLLVGWKSIENTGSGFPSSLKPPCHKISGVNTCSFDLLVLIMNWNGRCVQRFNNTYSDFRRREYFKYEFFKFLKVTFMHSTPTVQFEVTAKDIYWMHLLRGEEIYALVQMMRLRNQFFASGSLFFTSSCSSSSKEFWILLNYI